MLGLCQTLVVLKQRSKGNTTLSIKILNIDKIKVDFLTILFCVICHRDRLDTLIVKPFMTRSLYHRTVVVNVIQVRICTFSMTGAEKNQSQTIQYLLMYCDPLIEWLICILILISIWLVRNIFYEFVCNVND